MGRQRTKKSQQLYDTSPAKSTRSQVQARAAEPERKKRAPQRCRKCPNAPLRAECSHSVIGRQRALELEASDAALPQATPVRSDTNNARQESPNPFIYNTPVRYSGEPLNRAMQGPPEVSVLLTTPTRHISPIEEFLENESSSIFNATSSPIIDPLLLALSNQTNTASESVSSLATPSTSTQNGQSPSMRPTFANPFHDFVRGVYRGHVPHNIVRKKAKPLQIEQTSKSSKAFVENVNALVEKCEDISIKTGAWLFFGAQHPGARAAAINYASPRLKRDGREDTNKLATSFMTLINTVMASKRSDTIELQKKLEVERQENAHMRTQLEEAARVTAEANVNALQEVRRMLASYRPN